MKPKTTLIIICVMLFLLAIVPVAGTLAYFTDDAAYSGGGVLSLAWETELHEDVKDNDKTVTIKNTGDTDVLVRVRIFANKEYLTIENGSGRWKDGGDGWWYYKDILKPEAVTESIVANVVASDQLPDYEFNIIVVHESERVVYNNGTVIVKPQGWVYVPEAGNE
ncbi:MAG: hypothetical protein IKD81_05370 [Eubacteriaceae bacterium]|nr:hypothetical protein [Eubacteriaceae bacterium]